MLGTLSIESRFSDLIDGTLAVERKSIDSLNSKLEIEQTKKDSYSLLKNDFYQLMLSADELSNPQVFYGYEIENDFDDEFIVSVGSDVNPGKYSINVLQTAKQAKIISKGFANKDQNIGESGTIRITMSDKHFDVSISSINCSLQKIKEAFNDKFDNDLLHASIVNATGNYNDNQSYLVLTSNSTGANQNIDIHDVDGILAETLDISTIIQTPLDAEVIIDGFHVKSRENILNNIMDGVNIELLNGTGKTRNFTIVEDNKSLGRSFRFCKFVVLSACRIEVPISANFFLSNSDEASKITKKAISNDIKSA